MLSLMKLCSPSPGHPPRLYPPCPPHPLLSPTNLMTMYMHHCCFLTMAQVLDVEHALSSSRLMLVQLQVVTCHSLRYLLRRLPSPTHQSAPLPDLCQTLRRVLRWLPSL